MKTLNALSLVWAASAAVLLAAGPAVAQAPHGARTRRAAPRPSPAIVPRPTLAQSLKALDTSFAKARTMGISVSCAVLDVHGDLVAFGRMDHAGFLTVSLAQGKALASVMFGVPSRNLSRMASSPIFASINASVHDRMVPAQGALPILHDHRVIGAIGCSGGAPPQDEAAARAGLGVL